MAAPIHNINGRTVRTHPATKLSPARAFPPSNIYPPSRVRRSDASLPVARNALPSERAPVPPWPSPPLRSPRRLAPPIQEPRSNTSPTPVRSTITLDDLQLSDNWETVEIRGFTGQQRLVSADATGRTQITLDPGGPAQGDLYRLPAQKIGRKQIPEDPEIITRNFGYIY